MTRASTRRGVPIIAARRSSRSARAPRTSRRCNRCCVGSGLPWEQALRAVTLTPAEIFGVADRYGSLDAGKVANVVVWTGDPFDFATGVEHVFIRGKDIRLRSRQTELLERYKTLPPKY